MHLVRMLVASLLVVLVTNLVGMMVVTSSFAAFCFRLMLLMLCLKGLVRWDRRRLIFVGVFFCLPAQMSLVSRVDLVGLLVLVRRLVRCLVRSLLRRLVRRGRRRPSVVLSSVGPP